MDTTYLDEYKQTREEAFSLLTLFANSIQPNDVISLTKRNGDDSREVINIIVDNVIIKEDDNFEVYEIDLHGYGFKYITDAMGVIQTLKLSSDLMVNDIITSGTTTTGDEYEISTTTKAKMRRLLDTLKL